MASTNVERQAQGPTHGIAAPSLGLGRFSADVETLGKILLKGVLKCRRTARLVRMGRAAADNQPNYDRSRHDDLPAEAVMLTPPICTMGEEAHFTQYDVFATLGNGKHLMMGDDPRLPKMPSRPRLADFFRHRFVPMVANHLLQSASLAKKKGLDEKVIIACLL